jgi:hypothetical protein
MRQPRGKGSEAKVDEFRNENIRIGGHLHSTIQCIVWGSIELRTLALFDTRPYGRCRRISRYIEIKQELAN